MNTGIWIFLRNRYPNKFIACCYQRPKTSDWSIALINKLNNSAIIFLLVSLNLFTNTFLKGKNDFLYHFLFFMSIFIAGFSIIYFNYKTNKKNNFVETGDEDRYKFLLFFILMTAYSVLIQKTNVRFSIFIAIITGVIAISFILKYVPKAKIFSAIFVLFSILMSFKYANINLIYFYFYGAFYSVGYNLHIAKMVPKVKFFILTALSIASTLTMLSLCS